MPDSKSKAASLHFGTLLWTSLLAIPVAHSAAETQWSVTAGAMHTDNIEKAVDDKRGATIPEAGLAIEMRNQRPRLNVTLSTALTYSAYEQKLYATTSTPNAAKGAATLAIVGAIVPERFEWTLHDTLGTSTIAFIAPDAPSNRQLANLIGTGPTFTLPLGARGQAKLDGEWFETHYGTSLTDSKGYQGTASARRLISRSSSLAVQISASGIRYPTYPTLGEFRVTAESATLSHKGARSELSMEFGATRLESLTISDSSPLVRLAFRRIVSTRSTVSVRLGREYSNSAQSLQTNFDFYGVASTLRGAGAVPESFRSDYGQFVWSLNGDKLDLSVQALGRRESYPVTRAQDSTLFDGAIVFGRALTARLRLGARAQFEQREIRLSNLRSRDRAYGADLTLRLSRAISLSVGAERWSGSTIDLLRDYTENREFLRFGYASAAQR
jgi:hypothetical protein